MKMRWLAGLIAQGAMTGIHADTITVCPDGSCDHVSIQTAIDIAEPGDTVAIGAGTYTPTTTLDTRGKPLTLSGVRDESGTLQTWIRGAGIRPMRCISGEGADTVIVDLGFERGSAYLGGALYIDSSGPIFTRCEFRDNTAFSGGAVWVEAGSAAFEECVFASNVSYEDGGGIHSRDSDLTVFQCTFAGNSTRGFADGGVIGVGGGLLASGGTITVNECLFSNNSAYFGGACFMFECTNSVEDTIFDGNVAEDQAGAIQMSYLGEESRVDNCSFINNTSGSIGGALILAIGSCTVIDSVFDGNSAIYSAGMAIQSAEVSILDCSIRENDSDAGGGIEIFNSFGSVDVKIGDSFICGNTPDQITGLTWTDLGGNFVDNDCANYCRSDLDGDGSVAGSDLSLVLAAWGYADQSTADADLNGDGLIDGSDLALILSAWGTCSAP